MPTKETHELQKGMLAEFLSEQSEPIPTGIVWSGLETVNLETADDDAEIKVAILQFSSGCQWVTPEAGPVALDELFWNDLAAEKAEGRR